MAHEFSAPTAPLRILEIGNPSLFARAVPAQTDFYWTGNKPRQFAERAFGPRRVFKCLIDLRRGKYDLLAVHATQYAPWHPRSLLTVLRDWHVRAPLGLFAMFAWRFVHLFHDVPIAVIDLDDSFGIGAHNFFLLDACKAFFKRELPSDHWQAFFKTGLSRFPGRHWRSKEKRRRFVGKLNPISYGTFVSLHDTISAEKTTDIFFAGNIAPNSTVRTAGLSELHALKREGFAVDFATERLPEREFLQRMAAAWLAWSPAGFGWDCSRHYEAGLVGTVALMNYPTILRYQPLRDGEHCVLYALEPGGLAAAARAALADKPRLRRMAQAARQHVRTHHTSYARAEHVAVTVLGRRLDGSPVATLDVGQEENMLLPNVGVR
jgi:hypothetical protein